MKNKLINANLSHPMYSILVYTSYYALVGGAPEAMW